MNQQQLIDKYCFDYSWSPKKEEISHFTKFCDNIKSIEILKKTLDPANHPKTETGRVFRPNVATLWPIAQGFINEKAAGKRREAMSNVSPDEQCFYCNFGHVMGIQERVGLWSTYVAGRCECAQGDDTGYLAQRRPVKPTPEIQDYARAHSTVEHPIDCPAAADSIVCERNQPYRDERQVGIEFAGDREERSPYDFGDGWQPEPGEEGVPF